MKNNDLLFIVYSHKGFYVHNVLAKKDNLTSQQNNNEYRVKQ